MNRKWVVSDEHGDRCYYFESHEEADKLARTMAQEDRGPVYISQVATCFELVTRQELHVTEEVGKS